MAAMGAKAKGVSKIVSLLALAGLPSKRLAAPPIERGGS